MENHRSFCPVNLLLEVLGDKWSLLIVRDMMFEGKKHFREMLVSEERIASNILADRLNMLEREGILTKNPDPEHKQKFIYGLTEKSIDLLPVVVEMINWSVKYKPVDMVRYGSSVAIAEGGPGMRMEVKERLVQRYVMK